MQMVFGASLAHCTACFIWCRCGSVAPCGLAFLVRTSSTVCDLCEWWADTLLAPTGALVVMMVYYIYIYIYLSAAPAFSDFHSVPWCNWCYECHSKSLKQYQCNRCHKISWGYFGDISGIFWEYFGDILGIFREYFGDNLGIFWE